MPEFRPKTKARHQVTLKPYEAAALERKSLLNFIARANETTAPAVTVTKDGKFVSVDHPSQRIGFLLLLEALGTNSAEFALDLISQLLASSWDGPNFNAVKFKAMLAMLINSKPRDEMDAALATHAALSHQGVMKLARLVDAAENVMQLECTQRSYHKMSGIFVSQRDALKRGRAVAETNFTVQQNVGDGGRAAIVYHAAPSGVPNEPPAASPPALTDAKATPMRTIDHVKERDAELQPIKRFRPKLIK